MTSDSIARKNSGTAPLRSKSAKPMTKGVRQAETKSASREAAAELLARMTSELATISESAGFDKVTYLLKMTQIEVTDTWFRLSNKSQP